MRLIVARCEVRYTGRLNAFLPDSTRLLILKEDGSVLIHADAGGFKPLLFDGEARSWSSTSTSRRIRARAGAAGVRDGLTLIRKA